MKIPYVTEFFRKRRTIDALEELLEHSNEENRSEAKRFRDRLADQRDAHERLRKHNARLMEENETLREQNNEALRVLKITHKSLINALKDLESAGVKA
jgi:hypothetical protein